MFPVMSVDRTGLESILFGAKKNEKSPQDDDDEEESL